MEHFRIGRLHRGHLVKLTSIIVVKTKAHINEMIYLQRGLVKEYEIKNISEGFPGGAVVGSLPANAGDTGSRPGLGGSHMPRSN